MDGTPRLNASHRAPWPAAHALFTAGCTALGPARPTAPREALRVHAWTLPACPASPLQPAGTVVAPAIGLAADLLLDRIASALASAASADRDGVAWSGADARYLYFGSAALGGVDVPPAAALAACVVVALADQAGAQPAGWCAAHEAAPAASPAFDKTCSPEGRRLLAAAAGGVPDTGPAGVTGLPRIYAEIRLRPSRDGAAIAPEVLNLHYPAPLQPRAARTRDLAISLQLRLPEQARGANLFVLLRDLTPARSPFDPAGFARSGALWTAVPAYHGRAPAPADAGQGLMPVNILTEIRETGDTDAFLQALAAGFGDVRPALTKALK